MRIFVTGAAGQLGQELSAAFAGDEVTAGRRPEFELTDERSVRRAIRAAEPELVVHAAAHTDVDGCERDPRLAYETNALGTRFVAVAAREVRAALIVVSTDYVFDGLKGQPYLEWDEPHPLSVYGHSKLAGEREAQTIHDRCAVVRTSWVFSPRGKNFVRTMLRLAAERPELTVVDDEWGGPTLAADLATAIAALARRDVAGVYHFANAGSCSRFQLAERVVRRSGLGALVRPTSTAEYLTRYPLPARRPANSTLGNLAGASLGIELRPWEAAVDELVGSLMTPSRP